MKGAAGGARFALTFCRARTRHALADEKRLKWLAQAIDGPCQQSLRNRFRVSAAVLNSQLDQAERCNLLLEECRKKFDRPVVQAGF
jgi:hypothetical protein